MAHSELFTCDYEYIYAFTQQPNLSSFWNVSFSFDEILSFSNVYVIHYFRFAYTLWKKLPHEIS